MATATPVPDHVERPSFGPGRIIAIVAGTLGALIALGLVLGAVVLLWAHGTQRDSDGYLTTPTARATTAGYAITSEGLLIGDARSGPDWAVDALGGRARVTATARDGRSLFVGVAREQDVDRYLAGVAHAEATDVDNSTVESTTVLGRRSPAPPTGERFWVASTSGAGERRLEWKLTDGRWAIVVMDAAARRGVDADVAVGARIPALPWIALGLLAVGLTIGTGSGAALLLALREAPAGGGAAGASAAGVVGGAGAAGTPVAVRAGADATPSRWLWLIKWLLATPHWIVLAVLWAAAIVLVPVSMIAIAVTGRQPRAIFAFELGVLRWTWRVAWYALALGTDRYPPFTLAAADYPAELDVPEPEGPRSRVHALLAPWLLAIPHLAVMAVLFGWWNASWASGDTVVQAPGLLAVLGLIAGGWLLATGRLHADLTKLLLGFWRWTLRVGAYVLLLRDEYPPFRLDD